MAPKKKGFDLSKPLYMAVGVGFEPTEGINPQRFSRPPLSTTQPAHQKTSCIDNPARAKQARLYSDGIARQGLLALCGSLRYCLGGNGAAWIITGPGDSFTTGYHSGRDSILEQNRMARRDLHRTNGLGSSARVIYRSAIGVQTAAIDSDLRLGGYCRSCGSLSRSSDRCCCRCFSGLSHRLGDFGNCLGNHLGNAGLFLSLIHI